MSKRIVFTGLGVTTPIGNSIADFWSSLQSGKSGIDTITLFDASEYPSRIAAEVKDPDFTKVADPKEIRRTDRYILLSLIAADEALKDSGLNLENENPDRCGVIISSGIGGLATLETEAEKLITRGMKRVSPFFVPMMISDMASGYISIKYGLKGLNYAVVSACASSSHGIGDAMKNMQAGLLDVAVVGGAEAPICRIGMAGFCAMKALSTRNEYPSKASSPFDLKRDGFVMGEGAGVMIMETLEHALARNAHIYAELVGYGATADAYHLSKPAPDHIGAQRAMQAALNMAGISADNIEHINAHGTSTPYNDKYESKAIMEIFGDHAMDIAVNSTKSMTGHLLGASGGVELIASILALKHNLVPPTINYEDPDPECPLNYTPNEPIAKNINYAMSNSFGFGGHNASLIVKKYEPCEANLPTA